MILREEVTGRLHSVKIRPTLSLALRSRSSLTQNSREVLSSWQVPNDDHTNPVFIGQLETHRK